MHSVQKNTKKRGSVSLLSPDEIDKIYQIYSVMYSKGLNHYTYDHLHEELHQQGYRIAEYSGWTYMLKWLSNPEYYRINELGNESIIRNSDSGSFYFQKKDVIIDFSDFNNNCEYVQQVFQVLNSLLK
ncbi:hypothetical protein GLOIN_2v1489014 [Rhizophagus clarus]|uniref:Uncharacterized protein n=1 Tax=Rhizophagus clarus TaxID=94130 RepID=A0A8H3L121_9GLOM|nr:hypothetical protein GLOIN_2v1489014 [Rhizophagus clarus]